MIELVRVATAEGLKMKRTLALWLAPLAPLVIIALQMAVVLDGRVYYEREPLETWASYTRQTMFLWAVFMLPFFVTLETALLANLEHANQQWKHLYALPIRRGAIYAAKQLSGMMIIGLSMAALSAYTGLSGLALRLIAPGLGFEEPVPWADILRYAGLAYLSSWLIIAIHTWIALRWPSFVVASAAGIAFVIVSVVVIQSQYSPWYPWTLPAILVGGLSEGFEPWTPLGLASLGGVGGLAVAVLGGWEVSRRDAL